VYDWSFCRLFAVTLKVAAFCPGAKDTDPLASLLKIPSSLASAVKVMVEALVSTPRVRVTGIVADDSFTLNDTLVEVPSKDTCSKFEL